MLATRLLVSPMVWFMDMESSSTGMGATQFISRSITEVSTLPKALWKLSGINVVPGQGLPVAQGGVGAGVLR